VCDLICQPLNEDEDEMKIDSHYQTDPEELKMYLGGMGGTGKSQVIKALITFFDKHNEAHRIMILAPTRTAAALLNGSTYPSALGVQSDS
jgi:putative protein kinase ArgK-like GTPase of G3E family